jgi:hypothetical protein
MMRRLDESHVASGAADVGGVVPVETKQLGVNNGLGCQYPE